MGTRHRKRTVRARTEERLSKTRILGTAHLFPADYERPKKRADCDRVRGVDKEGNVLPCAFVSCRYHLYLDVLDTGALKLNFPDLEPYEIPVQCALDYAEKMAAESKLGTEDSIAEALNMTNTNVMLILRKLEKKVRLRVL